MPKNRRDRGPVLLMAVVGGLFAVAVLAGCVWLAVVGGKKGDTGRNVAAKPQSDDPIPDSFDPADGRRSLHWWVATADKAPYPTAQDTGNALRDKTMGDWKKERQAIVASKPVRWPVRIAYVTDKGKARLAPVTWPCRDESELEHWQTDRKADWTFDVFAFVFNNALAGGGEREMEFPFADPSWAPTVTKGTPAVLVATFAGVGETAHPFRIQYKQGVFKGFEPYPILVKDGRIERP